ncbi:ATP-binding protein [Anabaena sp. FACHB-1237]|uniref:P-loop NTPase fold protein n=1 Tax=Anabaena sp. FACHB-1237 TaxID=2692769 RepID=UPI0016811190|nr:P-loop NTPase fold protein [Anabaena sp. FACHB-1237]MBD2137123.1 ATP-binding protein [Anabaena sp. FACHB-1237]
MTNTPVSAIEAVNNAINSHNPFTNAGITQQQNIWGKGFPDVQTLNAHASNKVFEAIEFVRKSKSNQDKVTSIVITSPVGVGKTHLLSRIRHELEKRGGALFVYSGVNNYTDLNLVKYQLQQTLADSLSKTGSQEVMQWQEVAAAMVSEGEKNTPSPADLVKKFDSTYKKRLARNSNLIDVLQNKVIKNKPSTDPYIVRAILWTLSQIQVSFAKLWLSGEELAQSNANDLGLPNLSKTNQDREAEALNKIQQILNIVSSYNPVIICFDEIDIENNCNEDGLTTPLVIADLVKRLHDTLENSELGQGVVILTVMKSETWKDVINQQHDGKVDRLSKYTQVKPIELKPLNADAMVQLATIWLQEYYSSKNLIPPHPLYPFEEGKLREYGKNKPTVREALRWCADNFKIEEDPLPSDPFERFEIAFTRESDVKFEEYIEDGSRIADALYFGFNTLKGQTLEGVSIEEITNDIKPKSHNKNFINFKIIGNENGKEVKIGVAVIQDSQFTLNACLRRLNDYHTFDLTRGCLVRSKSKIEQMKKRSEGYKLLDELIVRKGGEHVDLIENQIRPLIVILAIYNKKEKYQLTEDQIFEIISKNNITFDNLLLKEILSDPSGNIIEVDDEDDLSDLFGDSEDIDVDISEVGDEDNLSDLLG